MDTTAITPDAVHAAIAHGHSDIYKLAAHFGVNHSNYTLRTTVSALADARRVSIGSDYQLTAN